MRNKQNFNFKLISMAVLFGAACGYAMEDDERFEAAKNQLQLHMKLNKKSGVPDSNSYQAIQRNYYNEIEESNQRVWKEIRKTGKPYSCGFEEDMQALAEIERQQNLEINKKGNEAKHNFKK